MTWVAQHHGPGGILSRFCSDEWVQAANWLRAMMEVSRPQGVRQAMTLLKEAPRATPFLARASGDFYEIKVAA